MPKIEIKMVEVSLVAYRVRLQKGSLAYRYGKDLEGRMRLRLDRVDFVNVPEVY